MIPTSRQVESRLELPNVHPVREIANLQASAEAAHNAACRLDWFDAQANAAWIDCQATTRKASTLLRPHQLFKLQFSPESVAAMVAAKREAAQTALAIYRHLSSLPSETAHRLRLLQGNSPHDQSPLVGPERLNFINNIIAQVPEGSAWLERRQARESAEAERQRQQTAAREAAERQAKPGLLVQTIEAAGTVLGLSKNGQTITATGAAVSAAHLAQLREHKDAVVTILAARKAATAPRDIV